MAWLLNRGIKISAKVETWLVGVKILIVLAVIAVGVFYIDSANLSPYFLHGLGGAATGAATVFFAVFWYNAMSTAAEESKEAARNPPKAIILSPAIAMVLYLVAATVLTGMVDYRELADTAAFSAAFESVGLSGFSEVVAAGAIVGIISVLFSFTLGASRVWYAISRDGLLPSWVREDQRAPLAEPAGLDRRHRLGGHRRVRGDRRRRGAHRHRHPAGVRGGLGRGDRAPLPLARAATHVPPAADGRRPGCASRCGS